ncbi:MAG TPA: arginase family protein [Candidatus Eisenbergiella merdipullorum]|uniref:Arginase family protein n=1 Tax=Candidatus Eisenbergiella merdipullorum TaxID=2838553 RepID=A0A9D2I8A5_9FIRM|nr:arginase family protein [Candidatus Eisenbergiella merdipullorum]
MNDGIQKERTEAGPIVLMNFTHVYEMEKFWKKEPHLWIDCTDMSGVNGYCDEAAAGQIRERLAGLPPEGLHFIDSGNFHYVSKFWTDKIDRDFVLILFDHHTDLQRSRFGDILSCGSWVRDVLDHNLYAKMAVLIGTDAQYLREVEPTYRERIVGFTPDVLEAEKTWEYFSDTQLEGKYGALPIYISIDKDVLSRKEEITDWDQGEMSMETMQAILRSLLCSHEVIGVDVCGECHWLPGMSSEPVRKNDSVNDRFIQLLKQEVIQE